MKTTMKDKFRHRLNPMHIVCRLIDLGLNMKTARRVAAWYEIKLYKPIMG